MSWLERLTRGRKPSPAKLPEGPFRELSDSDKRLRLRALNADDRESCRQANEELSARGDYERVVSNNWSIAESFFELGLMAWSDNEFAVRNQSFEDAWSAAIHARNLGIELLGQGPDDIYRSGQHHLGAEMGAVAIFLDKPLGEVGLRVISYDRRGYGPQFRAMIFSHLLFGEAFDSETYLDGIETWLRRRFSKSTAEMLQIYHDLIICDLENAPTILATHTDAVAKLSRNRQSAIGTYDGECASVSVDWVFAAICKARGIVPPSRHGWSPKPSLE